MEQATRWTNGATTWALRGVSEPEDGEVPNAVNVAPLRQSGEQVISIESEFAGPKPEWATALDLVQEACAALRASEERIEQLEAEADQSRLDSRGELEALQAQLRLAQREIERAYEQTAAATARATAAEAWLDRLGGSIVDSFGRLVTSPQHRAS